jgi:cell division protein FtsB
MRCPLCAEENQQEALVCRACRNDMRVPETLMTENRELKQQIVELRAELEQLLAARARRRTASPN